MGFASYYEDNLDARGESVRGWHRRPTLSKKNTKKTLRRGEPQKTQHVTTEEIEWRIQREMICQSKL